jgi:ankyrin repeat protein
MKEGGKLMGGEDEAIHEAALDGDVERLKAILDENGSLISAGGWFERTPLHYAAEGGSVECVRLLLDRGALVDARDGLHSCTPLFDAVRAPLSGATVEESLACARLLLERGADPNAKDSHRMETPLFQASSLEMLLLLEEYGADLGVSSSEDQYPFETHAYGGDLRLLRFWVERGADINHVPGFQSPALHAVITGSTDNEREEWERAEQIRWLLGRGADPDIADALNGQTALHLAAAYGTEEIARALCDGGADTNARDHEGRTPLHTAAGKGQARLVRLLLEVGADPNARDAWRVSALEAGRAEDAAEVVEILEPLTVQPPDERKTPEEIVARLTAAPEPCSDGEIAELESEFRVSLPRAYKMFLRLMGRGPRRFLESDHWAAFYPELLGLGRGSEYEGICDDLPENYFVFASRLGYYLFFVADGKSDDPAVFCFGDGVARSHKRAYDSFWDFIGEMITYDEVMSRRRLT